jgi:hypothetical protein
MIIYILLRRNKIIMMIIIISLSSKIELILIKLLNQIQFINNITSQQQHQ